MKTNKLFIASLLFLILLSFNGVVASEVTDNPLNETDYTQIDFIEGDGNNNVLKLDISLDEIDKIENSENDVVRQDVSTKDIYIGHNNRTPGGNGTFDNPFTTFKAACDNVNGEDIVNIYVFNGTYYLGQGMPEEASNGNLNSLKFNTNNLNIIGYNGSVIIKNYFNNNKGYNAEAFSLTSSSANFTFENMIFDFSGSEVNFYANLKKNRYNFFLPFYGEANLGIFDNCSFILPRTVNRMSGSEFNSKFISCSIVHNAEGPLFVNPFAKNTYHIFEYCVIIVNNQNLCPTTSDSPFNVSMNNVWFGQNTLPSYLNIETSYQSPVYHTPVSRYAEFKQVTVNYHVNNTYEIIGKLTWNGTQDQDGMENFQPMTVKLSYNGISEIVNLTNGTFRTVYTSSNSNHFMTVTLDNVEKELNFTTVNITAVAPTIKYGQDQIVNINFSQNITANVTIVVSNGIDRKKDTIEIINNDTIVYNTYNITGILKAGTYAINITLSGPKFFGSNSTELTVSKYKYGVDEEYVFTAPMHEVKVGDTATIIITLPKDVNGTVTVKFGNDTQSMDANQTLTVNFTTSKVGDIPVNITYGGNDKYEEHTLSQYLTVGKIPSTIEINDAIFTYGEAIIIPFNITNAKGVTVTVYNKDDDEVATNSSESNIIALDTLTAGEYSLYVKTDVDEEYYISDDVYVNLTINKANSSLDISDQEFTYATEAIINAVTLNSTGDIIATLMDENNNEIPVKEVSGDNITLPLLDVGKYTLTVTTNVDENHTNTTKSATITITKATPSMNVIVEPAENITVKDNVTLIVKLPTTSAGEVVIKVNGKQCYNVSAKETITINLSNDAGDYIVDVIYSGDKNYESDSTTKEFTISKIETTINANPIVFEEGDSSTMEVTIPDVESGVIFVDVGDEKFYGDINAGKATVLINGLVTGNYTAKISFAGDKKFNEATGNVAVNVTPAPDIIGELEKIISDLNDTVIAQNSTIESQAKEISSLNDTVIAQEGTIKNQTEQISALNDTIENQKEQINNLTHKKDTILVVDQTFSRVAVDYNAGERGGMFYAILKDSDNNVLANKTVQIAINGKIYKRTTDSEGKAGIQINLQAAGTYTYAISFTGDDTYNAAPLATSKLTVTKKKTTIKATNKAFKAKTKTKKISVTLKTVKNQYDKKTYLKSGKKVTLKVNGKTYTAKINKKGVAKFTIKITKKGKYTAKIKFAGDKTYKASSKTIKIRIK